MMMTPRIHWCNVPSRGGWGGTGGEQLEGKRRSRLLAIGQHNYKLHATDPRTGEEHWNISFARVHPLTPQARRAALDWRNAPSKLEDEITTADRGEASDDPAYAPRREVCRRVNGTHSQKQTDRQTGRRE